jgi:hypothetical protein
VFAFFSWSWILSLSPSSGVETMNLSLWLGERRRAVERETSDRKPSKARRWRSARSVIEVGADNW